MPHDSDKGHLDEAVASASPASVDRLLQADFVEKGVRSGADTLQVEPGAVVAHPGVRRTRLQRTKRLLGLVRAGLVLHKVALKLRLFRLRIAAAAFKCRVLGLQEPDVLAKDRRTAARVDQLLQKFEWSHGLPVRVRAAARVSEGARNAA